VVVVGGGIGGLATAALLARGGALVTLLERHGAVGGRLGTVTFDGFRFDTGPSWYFMPEVIEHLFDLLGERVEDHLDLVRLDPAYRVFPEPVAGSTAQTLDVVADAATNWRTFDALEPGAGEAMRAYVAASGEAYRTALDHFLYTTFARLDRVVSADVVRRTATLVRLLSQTLAGRVAQTVHHPVLRQVLGYHAVFLGSSPYRVPARRDVHADRGARADRARERGRDPHGCGRHGDRGRPDGPLVAAPAAHGGRARCAARVGGDGRRRHRGLGGRPAPHRDRAPRARAPVAARVVVAGPRPGRLRTPHPRGRARRAA
jgi:phytoene dehydrogenase-like protein